MKGRKPKPAALRALHASRTRPHHQDEPTIPASARPAAGPTFEPPQALVTAERVYWRYFAPLLAGAHVLTPADVETLADYCRACVAVDDRGRRLRLAFATKVFDRQTVRLLDSQLRGWIERKTKLASELGLTTIARTRVQWSGHPQRLDAQERPASKLAQLQEQATALRRPIGVR